MEKAVKNSAYSASTEARYIYYYEHKIIAVLKELLLKTRILFISIAEHHIGVGGGEMIVIGGGWRWSSG